MTKLSTFFWRSATYLLVCVVFIFSSGYSIYAQNMSEKDIESIFGEWTMYEDCVVAETQPTENTNTSQDGSTQDLAKQMLDNDNITYWTNDSVNTRDVVVELSEGKQGSTTASNTQQKSAEVNPSILKFILEAAEKGKIMVNALTDKRHSDTSNHYQGLAVDIDKNSHNTTIPVSELMKIAEKHGGVKNSETSHHHFDFTNRPKASDDQTKQTADTNTKYKAKGNIPIEGRKYIASVYGTSGQKDSNGKYIENLAGMEGGPNDEDGKPLKGRAVVAEMSGNTALGSLPYGEKIEITYQGKSVIAEVSDNGPGAGEHSDVDLWRQVADLLDFPYGKKEVTIKGVDNSTPTTPVDGSATSSAAPESDNTNGCTCSENAATGTGSNVVENLSAVSPDPAMEKMLKDIGLPKMRKFIPLYQKAAQEEGMPFNWELLAGLHWTESDLSRKWVGNGVQTVTGPFQQMTSELSQHLDDEKYKDLKTLVAPGGGLIGTGKEVNDKEFVVLARLALARWVKQALGDDYEKLKSAPVPFKENVDSNNVFWKIMGRWNPGAEGFQGFTGYNNTNYKAPQPVTGNYGTGLPWNKPGVATTYYLLKKNGVSGVNASGGCTQTADEAGNLTAIDGTKEEIAEKILSHKGKKLKLGNYGNATTQESDIRNELKKETLIILLAMLEQSGVTVPLNALRADHALRGAHGDGRAIDIGYYGNGNGNHKPDGDKLYKFLYRNREMLKIDQMIWQYPPNGYKCIYGGKPADCDSAYPKDINDHYHHIHVGVGGN